MSSAWHRVARLGKIIECRASELSGSVLDESARVHESFLLAEIELLRSDCRAMQKALDSCEFLVSRRISKRRRVVFALWKRLKLK